MIHPLLIVALYLIVDVIYVLSFKGTYNSVVQRIQGEGFPKKSYTLAMAVISYLILGFSWWYLVLTRITKSTLYKDAWILAIVFALAVYGVFNATLFVMFKNWDWKILIQDTLWGVSNISVFTLGYLYLLKASA
jgi:uncharacterized membrane protein